MRTLREMDEGTGEVVVDPIETDMGGLSNDADSDTSD
jgi:hypothetical protein